MTQPIVRTTLPVEVSTTFSSEDYRFENLEEHLKKISHHQTWPCSFSLLFGESFSLTTQEVSSKSPSGSRDQEHIQRAGREIKSLLLDISDIKDKKRVFKSLFEFFSFIDKEAMETTFLKSSKEEPSYFQKLLNSTSDYPEEHKFFALALALWHLREANRSFAQHLATKNTLNFNEQKRINYNEDLKKALYFCSNALKIDLKLGQKCSECMYVLNELIFHITSNCLQLRLKNSQLDESYFQEVFDQIEQKKELCFSPTHSSFLAQLYTTVIDTIPDFEHDSREKYRCKIDPAQRRRKECQYCPASPQPIPHKYLPALQEYRQLFERFTSEPADVASIRSNQADLTGRLIVLADKVLEDAFLIVGPPPCPYDIRVLGSVGREEACAYSDIEFMILYSYRESVYSGEYQEELRKKWHEEYFRTLAEVFNFLMILVGESGTAELVFPGISTLEGFRLDPGVNPGHDVKLIGTPEQLARRQEDKEAAIPQERGQIIRHSQSLKKFPRNLSLFHDYTTFMREILDQNERREGYALQLFSHRWEDYDEAWKVIDFQKIDLKRRFINLFHLLSDIAFYKGIRSTNTLDIITELSRGAVPVFIYQSGELMREFFASLYHIRSRIHLFHERQHEEAFAPHSQLPIQERGRLQDREKKQLEKCYWLVLRPLYRALEKVVKSGKRFEEVFNSLDLLQVAAEDIFQLQEGEGRFRSALVHLVAYVARHPPYFEMLKKYYQTISDNPENLFLKLSIIETLENVLNQNQLSSEQSLVLKSLIEELAAIPDSTGFRLAMMHEERAFHTRLKKATSSSAESFGKIKEVRIESSIRNPELRSCFLTSDVIQELLDETGHIRNSYPGSAHLVTGSKWGLHFKEMPVQPLMEYAIYNLFFRIGGHLSPLGELVHFKIKIRLEDGSEKDINYPVLISKSLSTDKTLKTHIPSEIKDLQAWKRWAWMTLCTLLTKSGDGLPSNYIFEGENIFCVDNDISFVIPFTKEYRIFKQVHFCSAIFFLYYERFLHSDVLEEFCRLDIDEILYAWIEDVIQKEKEYLGLFTEEDRKRWFEDKDPKKRFSATAVFCEGTLTTLKLQFHRLQNFLLFNQKKRITALDLLQQMTQICDFSQEIEVGPYVAQAYREALVIPNLTLSQRISEVRRERGGSLSLADMHKVCLGIENAPSFEKVEKLGRWTPTEARQELYVTLLKRSSPYLSVRNSEKQRVIRANFRGLAQDESSQVQISPLLSEARQRLILKALIALVAMSTEKPTTVVFQCCDVLDSNTLEPFLHEDLEVLELVYCPKIQALDIQKISEKCPFLRSLKLVGCPLLKNLVSSSLFSTYPLNFSRKEPQILSGHKGTINTVISLEGGQKLASGSEDNTIRIWDVETGQVLKILLGHTQGVTTLISLEDGKKLASGSEDNTIRIWDVETGRELKTLRGHTPGVTTLSSLEDRKRLASASKDGTIQIWDTEKGRELKTLRGHTHGVCSLISLEGGKKLASESTDGTNRIWDIETGQKLNTFSGHTSLVTTLISLEGGKKLASVSNANNIQIWDIETGRVLKTLSNDNKSFVPWVTALISLENGKKLASGNFDGTIIIWDVETEQKLKTLSGHGDWVRTLISLKDGKKLAWGSRDGTIRIWDVKTGQELNKLFGHERGIRTLISLEGGKKLVSVGNDRTIRTWNLEPGLENLHIDQCENLESLRLKASSLKTFVVKNNRSLNKLDFDSRYFPQMQFDNCPNFDANQFFSQQLRHVVVDGHPDIFNSVLEPSLCLILAKLMTPEFQEKLFSLIERSKKEPKLGLVAANAITILNMANVAFVGKDFRGIRIPGAYLEGANFARADLTGADLTGVNLSSAILSSARLDRANMEKVELKVGKGLKVFSPQRIIFNSLVLLESQKKLASASSDKTLRIWEVETGIELFRKNTEYILTPLVSLENGKKLALGGLSIQIWDVKEGQEFKPLCNGGLHTVLLALEDGKKLASVFHHLINIWDIESGEHLIKLVPNNWHARKITALCLLDEGYKFVSGCENGIISIWTIWGGARDNSIYNDMRNITSLVSFEGGSMLASGSKDKTIRIWDIEKKKQLEIFSGHSSVVNTLCLLESEKKLASGSDDCTIRIWDLNSGRQLSQVVHTNPITTLIWREPNLLYAGDSEGNICCWKIFKENAPPRLLWGPHLTFANVDIAYVLNLSPENQAFMLQQGAKKTISN